MSGGTAEKEKTMRIPAVLVLLLAFFAAVAAGGTPARAARQETIAAIVNSDAVTASEVAARLRLAIASSGLRDSKDLRDRMAPQIVNLLIDERLKLQEAAKLGIKVPADEVRKGVASIAAQNKLTEEQFREVMRRQGISASSLEDQIRAQIAWSLVVQQKLRPQVQINDSEVDAMLRRLGGNVGKTEYLLAEIFLPFGGESGNGESDIRQLADRLSAQLAGKQVPFQSVAAQFSQSASAARGGDIGWLQADQLPEELAAALPALNEGTLSKPLRTTTGYYILSLRKKREISSDTLPSRDAVLQRLGIERLERLQRRYLMDLKAEAFIEQRA